MADEVIKALQAFYASVNSINNNIMRVTAETSKLSGILIGGDGEGGMVHRLDGVCQSVEQTTIWLRDYVATRQQTCPVLPDVGKLRDLLERQAAETEKTRTEVLEARISAKTKVIVAVISALSLILGGAVAAIIQAITVWAAAGG